MSDAPIPIGGPSARVLRLPSVGKTKSKGRLLLPDGYYDLSTRHILRSRARGPDVRIKYNAY
jgi:hypothetical protein